MVRQYPKALELIYRPDGYLCTWIVPDGDGGWARPLGERGGAK